MDMDAEELPIDAQGSVARAFVAARLKHQALTDYPGPVPAGLGGAYAIQQQAIGLWPDVVQGWKVGLIPPPHAAQVGQTRLFGPIFRAAVREATADPMLFAAIPGGFAAVEAEYVLRLAKAVPPREGWSASGAAATVAEVHVAVELAGSPFAEINDHGPLVTISDFGNNAGLIVGAGIPGGLEGLEGLTCRVEIDGVRVGSGGPGSVPGGPIASLVELLNHMGRAGQTLPAGTLVSTGAATGVHAIGIGQSAVADFGQLGCIAIRVAGAMA